MFFFNKEEFAGEAGFRLNHLGSRTLEEALQGLMRDDLTIGKLDPRASEAIRDYEANRPKTSTREGD